jgi:hypothetical protein
LDFLNIAALQDPRSSKRWQAEFDVTVKLRVTPGSRAIINSHWVVRFG